MGRLHRLGKDRKVFQSQTRLKTIWESNTLAYHPKNVNYAPKKFVLLGKDRKVFPEPNELAYFAKAEQFCTKKFYNDGHQMQSGFFCFVFDTGTCTINLFTVVIVSVCWCDQLECLPLLPFTSTLVWYLEAKLGAYH